MLNKEGLLNKTNRGFDVFKHFIKTEWKINRKFLNPLYQDTKPSCYIYFDRKNQLYKMKDFGNEDYSGDCFSIVAKIYNLDCRTEFHKVLSVIHEEMKIDLLSVRKEEPFKPKPVILKKETKPYSFREKGFSIKELEFWKRYGIIPELLRQYGVISIEYYKSENSEGKAFTIFSNENEPVFAYKSKNFIKLYRPFSVKRFLYGGNPANYCFGLEQLPVKGDILFITGGEKDVLSLAARGFSAICFNSETSHIPKSVIEKIRFRFKHIILLYDVDEQGLKSSLQHEQELKQFGIKRLILPLKGTKAEKDISDYFKKGFTKEDFLQLFLDFLEREYSYTLSVLKTCEVDIDNPPKETEKIITYKDVPIGTKGNLLTITGGEGSGKSNYVSALISGTINTKSVIDTLGLAVSKNTERKAVLLYDTEQSELQLYKNLKIILKRAGVAEKPKELRTFSLTGLARNERLKSIIESMDKFYHEYRGIYLTVIDGIADLVQSANDEIESLKVIDELYRLAGIYQTCIICVLHYTPNGLKLRGHLGSELQRKSAAILSIEIEKQEQVSQVKTLKVRDGSPLDVPVLEFAWNKELEMHSFIGEKNHKRKETELLKIAKTIFSEKPSITYYDLCVSIQNHLDGKDRTAKNYIKFMKDKGIIIKETEGSNYKLNSDERNN